MRESSIHHSELDIEARRFVEMTDWYRDLSAAERTEVLQSLRSVIVDEGGPLARAGFPAEYWVGVIDGLGVQSIVLANGLVMHMSAGTNGNWFGEGTLIKGGNWGYDAIALRETRIALIPATTFNWLREHSASFNWHLQSLLNARLSYFMSLAVTLRSGSAIDRVAATIWHLCNGSNNQNSQINISQRELGLLSALSRQHTNAALHKLRDMGLIALHRASIEVLNVHAFREALIR